MRIRTNIIIEESVLARIDVLAKEKPKRAAVIEKALLEYIEREESKLPPKVEAVATTGKGRSKTK